MIIQNEDVLTCCCSDEAAAVVNPFVILNRLALPVDVCVGGTENAFGFRISIAGSEEFKFKGPRISSRLAVDWNACG